MDIISLSDITVHPEWLQGQTIAWCNQLAAQTGKYEYPWKFTVEGTAVEQTFSEELAKLIRGKVLDVGCGHGEFANRWTDQAEEVIGYDMTEGFLLTANRNRKPNVHFVLGRTQDGLPFRDHEFDVAYTKKGPTSWYAEAGRILKPEGDVLSLHPGDRNGEGGEMGTYFPGLFSIPAKGTPILDKIKQRISESSLKVTQIRVLRESGWIPSAEDVLARICFGQNERFCRFVKQTHWGEIRRQFELHRSQEGIKTTGFYYLIYAKAAKVVTQKEAGI